MKAVIAALALVATGLVVYQNVVSNMNQPQIDELWASWKAQHGKAYTATQELTRKSVFAANHAKIMAHNANPESTFTMALNKFADLTADEFKEEVRCMDKAQNSVGDEYCPSAVNCPTLPSTSQTSWDWRKKGAVTPIKNQGQCGSCWAFSTTGSLEGLYYLDKNVLLSFSEQQLVDCSSSCYGCNGCWPYVAMEYSAKHGMALEKLYPYKGYDESCRIPKNISLINTNTGYQCVAQKDAEQMYAATVQQPVSIAVEADQSAWQFYNSGVVKSGCGDGLDHAVLIVGFDKSEGYFIVKNSWGTSWGESGYIRISDDSSANSGYGVCGIYRCGTLPISK